MPDRKEKKTPIPSRIPDGRHRLPPAARSGGLGLEADTAMMPACSVSPPISCVRVGCVCVCAADAALTAGVRRGHGGHTRSPFSPLCLYFRS